jgi:two-component system cell cycle response regulator CpdR
MTSDRVLLVEDDELMGALFELVLADAGYQVARAKSGQEALARLESDAPPIDAVISDIELGEGPDGWQVARRARARSPTMPVIYITGGRGDDWAPQHVPLGVMLQKPFHVDTMVVTLRDLLQGERQAGRKARLA